MGAAPSSRRSSARLLAAASALAILTGCATTRIAHPLTQTPLAASTPAAQGEFWYQLAKRPIASNDEAFHALLLYEDGKDADTTYAARVTDLSTRRMLPKNFTGASDEAVDRGTLAVALDQMLHIKGGLTMQLFGPSPRYALRAAEDRGLFPPSSPNQAISGGEFVGVMQKAEEYEHGNPADNPVNQLPDQVHRVAMIDPTNADALAAAAAGIPTPADPPFLPQLETSFSPVYLDAIAPPGATPDAQGNVHLRAIVTGTQGDLVEIRTGPDAPWKPARPGMLMLEGTEIRTGPKSAIRFLIPADEAFCLDSQGELTLQQAVVNLRKATTRLGLAHGRLREDLSHTAPVQIEEAGLAHDTVIQSPDSALALRGTKVSLFEQPSFEPVAVSLTGQAYFTNTDGLRVAFGGRKHTVIVGADTSAAQEADARQGEATSGNTPRLEFETRELAIVSQRGGFQTGDVIVGNQYLSDFGYRPSIDGQTVHDLPGALQFVLTWNSTVYSALNALSLAVISPLSTTTAPDYVANLPFIAALNPNSTTSVQLRKTLYPQISRSGGQISYNSVGPAGLELAYWPKHYALGTYKVAVFNILDLVPSPTSAADPVPYTLNVYQNGINIQTASGVVGQYQTQSTAFTITAPTTPAISLQRRQKNVKLTQATASSPTRRRTS